MPAITIYHDSTINVQVVEGEPPVDQTDKINVLVAQIALITQERDALKARIAKAVADLQ